MQEDLSSHTHRYSEGGKVARVIDNVEFRLKDDLPEPKRRRLEERGVKPVEEVTFAELKSYNRDQLRAYCYIYGIPRKKKAEMELDMARYAAAFHPGDPNYDLATFESVESTPVQRNTTPSNSFLSTPYSRSSIYYQPNAISGEIVSPVYSHRPAGLRSGAVGNQASHYSQSGVLRGDRFGLESRRATPVHRVAPSSRPIVKQRIEKNSTKNQREHARQTAAKYRMALDGKGPLKVPVVANAASYFHNVDEESEKKIRNEAFERYERNNKLLLELFERPIQESTISERVDSSSYMEDLMKLLTTNVPTLTEDGELFNQEEPPSLNLKDLYKIDNIKTMDEFWQVKDEMEKQYNVSFIHSPSNVKLVSMSSSKSTNFADTVKILQLR
ncbi:hypothetical protein GAYE_SCF22MG4140 [Galdieria yellowstonensis]|uniref:Uncharacterized protein n=1 Tax=Galdieria yellowstonensis TaxID=3028027 RepID=A0AAV9IG80_9RHOD|nr:hypothetical protein GAYE_SCF22MG4140 [Galdieria yellowstonensis]